MACRNICAPWKVYPRYDLGEKYCRACVRAIPVGVSESRFCPCCGAQARYRTKSSSARREKLRVLRGDGRVGP